MSNTREIRGIYVPQKTNYTIHGNVLYDVDMATSDYYIKYLLTNDSVMLLVKEYQVFNESNGYIPNCPSSSLIPNNTITYYSLVYCAPLLELILLTVSMVTPLVVTSSLTASHR